jgi:hypothetical protein
MTIKTVSPSQGILSQAVTEDSSGQVWVSNENGIERYNRSDNSFTHFGVDRPGGRKNYTYCQLLGFVSANELWFLETEKRTIKLSGHKDGEDLIISGLDATNAQFYKGSGQTIHVWSSYDKEQFTRCIRIKN